ncbi:MAG: hypothetical protein K1X95_03070 [Acidimicrobiia bacterium]|nr:hypothetical protein [Acidimicrobiia bacterium]
MRVGSAMFVVGLAVTLQGCGPSLPSTPDSYVVPVVGATATRGDGAAVDAYRSVFGDTAVVYAVGPDDAQSGLPAAIVAVVALGGDVSEADVVSRALGPGDEVAERDIDGVAVRSATSRQGDITLEVRIWRPAEGIAVVVIGTRSPAEADAVLSAVARQAGAARGGDGGTDG